MGKNWVLIRGIVSEEFHWWHMPKLIQERFPRDQVLTADLLGNGKFHAISTPLDIFKNIEGLRQQVPQPGKKILLGFSLGAMLALEWAYLHPEEVEAVVLINTSLSNSPILHRIRPLGIWQIAKASRQKDLIKREEIILRMTTCLKSERIHKIAPIWAERSEIFPTNVKNFYRQLLVAHKISQRPQPPLAPVLVLSSKNDQVVNPKCSDKIAKTWGIPHFQHSTAGHDLTLEDPQWVLDRISENYNQELHLSNRSQGTVEPWTEASGDF